jgi:hypothetical protein
MEAFDGSNAITDVSKPVVTSLQVVPPFVVTEYPVVVPATIVAEPAGDTARAVTVAPSGPMGLHEFVPASIRGAGARTVKRARSAGAAPGGVSRT